MKNRLKNRALLVMSTSKLLLAGIIMTTISCSSDSSEPNISEGRTIAFGIEDQTRATAAIIGDLNKIGVYGYSHPAAGWAATLSADLKPDYFLNKGVIKNGANWTYDGVVKYWPDAARKVSFFAYAPYSDVNPAIVLSPTSAKTSGVPTLAYTVASDVTKQIDLLWDNRMIDKNYGGTLTKVAFNMQHALTSVDFKVKLNDNERGAPFLVTFGKVSLTNVVGAGTLDLSKGKVAGTVSPWSPVVRTASNLVGYTLTPANAGLVALTLDARNETAITGSYSYHALNTAAGIMMLIPQKLGNDVDDLFGKTQMVVEYSVANVLTGVVTPIVKTFDLSDYSIKTFEPGVGVSYSIVISINSGVYIKVEVGKFLTIDKWVSGGTETVIVN